MVNIPRDIGQGGARIDTDLHRVLGELKDNADIKRINLTFADSPYTITEEQLPSVVSTDTTDGQIIVYGPEITAEIEKKWAFIYVETGDNPLTIRPSGTDTIDGYSEANLRKSREGAWVYPHFTASPHWDFFTTTDVLFQGETYLTAIVPITASQDVYQEVPGTFEAGDMFRCEQIGTSIRMRYVGLPNKSFNIQFNGTIQNDETTAHIITCVLEVYRSATTSIEEITPAKAIAKLINSGDTKSMSIAKNLIMDNQDEIYVKVKSDSLKDFSIINAQFVICQN